VLLNGKPVAPGDSVFGMPAFKQLQINYGGWLYGVTITGMAPLRCMIRVAHIRKSSTHIPVSGSGPL
jgi:hypothetical protein